MWKLVSAREDAAHIFSEGDMIRTRAGSHTIAEYVLVRHSSNNKLIWKEEGGRELYVGWASPSSMDRGYMSGMNDFYGKIIDLWVPDEKVEPTAPVEPTRMQNGFQPDTTRHDESKDKQSNFKVVLTTGDTFVLKGVYTGKVIAFVNISHTNAVVRNRAGDVIQKLPVENFCWADVTRPLKTHTSLYQRTDDFSIFYKQLMKNVAADKALKAQRREVADRAQAARMAADNGQYIIWCPTAEQAPQKILVGAAQAKAVAASMSERHGKEFYWARLMGKATQKVVTKTTTAITIL